MPTDRHIGSCKQSVRSSVGSGLETYGVHHDAIVGVADTGMRELHQNLARSRLGGFDVSDGDGARPYLVVNAGLVRLGHFGVVCC